MAIFAKGKLLETPIQNNSFAEGLLVKQDEQFGKGFILGMHLHVAEGQKTVFCQNQTVANAFGPGNYTLDTQNLRVLCSMQRIFTDHDLFQADIYHLNTAQIIDLPWQYQAGLLKRDNRRGLFSFQAQGDYAFFLKQPVDFLSEMYFKRGIDSIYKVTAYLQSYLSNAFETAFNRIFVDDTADIERLPYYYSLLESKMIEIINPLLKETGIAISRVRMQEIKTAKDPGKPAEAYQNKAFNQQLAEQIINQMQVKKISRSIAAKNRPSSTSIPPFAIQTFAEKPLAEPPPEPVAPLPVEAPTIVAEAAAPPPQQSITPPAAAPSVVEAPLQAPAILATAAEIPPVTTAVITEAVAAPAPPQLAVPLPPLTESMAEVPAVETATAAPDEITTPVETLAVEDDKYDEEAMPTMPFVLPERVSYPLEQKKRLSQPSAKQRAGLRPRAASQPLPRVKPPLAPVSTAVPAAEEVPATPVEMMPTANEPLAATITELPVTAPATDPTADAAAEEAAPKATAKPRAKKKPKAAAEKTVKDSTNKDSASKDNTSKDSAAKKTTKTSKKTAAEPATSEPEATAESAVKQTEAPAGEAKPRAKKKPKAAADKPAKSAPAKKAAKSTADAVAAEPEAEKISPTAAATAVEPIPNAATAGTPPAAPEAAEPPPAPEPSAPAETVAEAPAPPATEPPAPAEAVAEPATETAATADAYPLPKTERLNPPAGKSRGGKKGKPNAPAKRRT